MAKRKLSLNPRRGRPRKFTVPSRPVTLTLPDHVIDALRRVDTDLGRAIVRLAETAVAAPPRRAAELSAFGGRAVIVVTPSRSLERQTGAALLHLPDGRAIISFDRSMTVAQLELMIADALEAGNLASADREVFQGVAEILRSARRSSDTTLSQRQIIVLESRRRSRTRRSA